MDKDKFINYLQSQKETLKKQIQENSITCKVMIESKILLIDDIMKDIESEKFNKRIW